MKSSTRILAAAAALWLGGTALAQEAPQAAPPPAAPAPPQSSPRVDLPPIVPVPTGQRLPGKVIWFDLLSHDPGAARPFYEGVLGWTFEDRNGYLVGLDAGVPVAGILRMPAPAPGAAVPQSRWMPLISAPDVARAAAAVQKAGGRILEGPGSLGSRGRYVAVADPRGAQFVLVTASGGDPLDADAPPPGWMWAELWTDDLKGSATFYKAVVGYEVWQVGSGKAATWIFGSGGRPRARAARMPFEKVTAQWLPYVVVKDLKASLARTTDLGGHVLRKPGAKGPQFAVISDPGGATLILEQRPEQPADESAQAPLPGAGAVAGAAAAAGTGTGAGTGPTPPATQPAPTGPTGAADPFGIGAAQERSDAEAAAAAAAAVSGGAVTAVPGADVGVVVAPSPFVNVWIAPPAWGPYWGPSWWAYPPGWVGAPWWGAPPVWGPGWMPPAYPGRPPFYPGYRPPPPPPRPSSGAYPRPPAPAPRPGAPGVRPAPAPSYRSAPPSRPAPSAPPPSSRPAPSAPRR